MNNRQEIERVSRSCRFYFFEKMAMNRIKGGKKMIENNSDNTQIKNADEMMYEAGFEKDDEYSNEDKVLYNCLTENDRWIVCFFRLYGRIVNYTISHSHYFETDGEWKEMDVIVDMNLHKAIHQVLLEHGWL